MIEFEIPIKTVSESNCSEHWTLKSKRHQQQQLFVRVALDRHVMAVRLPCTVTLTRLSPRTLDDDNLRGAMKWIRDEVSEWIFPEKRNGYINAKGKLIAIKGRADDDRRVSWVYDQEKTKRPGIRVKISFDQT